MDRICRWRRKCFKCYRQKTLLCGELNMAESITPQTVISAEEALRTEIILNQALIDILIGKGFISENELLNSIRKIKRERDILAENLEISS
jgi:hypothetical protein